MLLCILVSVVHLITGILATNNVKQLNTILFTSFKNIFSGITQTFNQCRMSNMVVFVRLSGKTVVICLHLFEGSFTVNISR
jgi:hypothetical protein